MINCAICGKLFKPKSSIHVYCSKQCSKVAERRRKKEIKLQYKLQDLLEKERLMMKENRKKATLKIKPLDEMSEDELLHYGRTQTAAQLGR